MNDQTKIEWADFTFNPWIGCTKVSSACDKCYAETQNNHRKWNRDGWGARAPRTRTSAANWKKPLKWQKQAKVEGRRYRVFCASLADVFDNHGSITSGWHGDLWHLISQCPDLDWLLLTKRPQNIKKMLPEIYGMPEWGKGWPNVWLGTTVENQTEAIRRIPHLLDIPAKIHFLSCEPLLGPIDFAECWHGEETLSAECWGDCSWCENGHRPLHNCWQGMQSSQEFAKGRSGIDWVIAGGESGSGARPTHPDWHRSLRDQCADAGVPFFFKQWGEWAPGAVAGPNESAIGAADWFANEWDYYRVGKSHPDQHRDDEPEMFRIGKKRAGRKLDGVEHNEVPT